MLLSAVDGNTFYDIVLKSGSPLENYAAILLENNLTFDSEPVSTEKINVKDSYIYQPPFIVLKETQPTSNIKNFITVDNQTIYDIALMTYGSLERVVDLKLGDLDESIPPNQLFTYDYSKISNYVLYSQFQNKIGYICSDNDLGVKQAYLVTEDSVYLTTEDGKLILV